MKASKLFVSMVFGITFANYAFATVGGVDGGGGIGVRCAHGSGAAKQFELLDLHEARLRGVQVSHSPRSEDEATALASRLFVNLFWNPDTIPIQEYDSLMFEILKPFLAGKDWQGPLGADSGYSIQLVQSLPLSDDAGNYNTMPGCQLEQIAYFDDTTKTLAIANNWHDLDWLDRAALISHEMAYLMNRRSGMEYFGQNIKMTSERARFFVGDLYSPLGVIAHADSIPSPGFAKCSDRESSDGNMTYAYVYDDGAGNTLAVFNVIHGHDSPYQMKASFAGLTPNALTDESQAVNASATLTFSGEPNAPTFILRMTKSPGSEINFDVLQEQSGVLTPVAPTQFMNCWFPASPYMN